MCNYLICLGKGYKTNFTRSVIFPVFIVIIIFVIIFDVIVFIVAIIIIIIIIIDFATTTIIIIITIIIILLSSFMFFLFFFRVLTILVTLWTAPNIIARNNLFLGRWKFIAGILSSLCVHTYTSRCDIQRQSTVKSVSKHTECVQLNKYFVRNIYNCLNKGP